MRILKRLNPIPGVRDFWSEFSRPNEYRWPVLVVSLLITGTLFYSFTSEKTYIPPAAPEVTYITSFDPDRTDEEIMASNIANQQRKDALAARQQQREELRKELYRELGRASGLDVDRMEAEIEADREAGEPSGAPSLSENPRADTAE